MRILDHKYIRFTLYFLLGLSLIISLLVTVRRARFEAHHQKVETAIGMDDIRRLALWSGGMDPYELLLKFKEESGLTSVVIGEETLTEFIESGKITVLKGSEIMNMYRVGNVNQFILTRLYQQVKVMPDYYYLIIDEDSDYERVYDFLVAEFGTKGVKRIGNFNILEVVDSPKDIFQVGLGFSPDRIQRVKEVGINPIFQFAGSNRVSQEMVRLKFANITSYVNNATVIFDGSAVLGYPTQIAYIQDKIQDYDLNLGIVEFNDQLGGAELKKGMAPHVLRVHQAEDARVDFMPRDKLVARYLRGAKERNMKILWVVPYFKSMDALSVVDYNIKFVKEINEGLSKYGMKPAAIKSLKIESYKPASNAELFMISLGVFITILFLLNYIIRITTKMLVMTVISVIFLFYIFYWNQWMLGWSQGIALITAIIFPTLAIISQFPRQETLDSVSNRWPGFFLFLGKTLGICVVGGLLIVGVLSRVEFLFSIEQFWGVKFAFLIPLGFIALYFFLRPHRIASMIYVLKRLFYAPVRTSGLLVLMICFGALGILLLRSGNYMGAGAIIPDEGARNILERLFHVRPRTKEFLIGYPFLFLSYMMVDREISRQWIWFFVVIGSVSLTSLINSFCHTHTPLEISLYRTILGIVLGVMMGALYYVGVKALKWIYRTLL